MKHDLTLVPFDATPSELVEAARVAEDAGFDGVWTYDHLSGTTFGAAWTLDPWTVLAAVATATDRLTIGPLVVNSIVRHPAHVAVAAATLQSLSGGRAMLGLGAGAGPDRFGKELAMVGMPRLGAAERRGMVEESVAVIRSLWRGDPEMKGTHFELRDATAFLTPDPAPPIVLGANGPKMAELAGRVADGINLHGREEDLEGLVETARRAAGQEALLVTVEAPLEEEWMAGTGRERLEQIRVDRVIYRWRTEHGLGAIDRAARLLDL
jgi:alkanesulfonate monooxygenase SsuD/methylene tetrahydromethanopterin reductase-like flavin-dependent oxidoreductase (luciferase family)